MNTITNRFYLIKSTLTIKAFLLFLFLTFSSQQIFSQVVIAGWDFSPLVGGTDNYGLSPLSLTTTAVGSNGQLVKATGISTVGPGRANAWGGTGFRSSNSSAATAITDREFITFTVNANPSFQLSLSAISAYNIRRSSGGPNIGQWQYALNGVNFTNIGSAITWGTILGVSGNAQTAITLSGITALQNLPVGTVVTFRLLVYGATIFGGQWYFNDPTDTTADDLIVTGFINPPNSTFRCQ